MKKNILLILVVIALMPFSGLSQTTGDYRSNNASFNWSTNTGNVWQRWNGASWVSNPAEGYPGQNATGIAGTVTIQSGHAVTANTDITTNDLGNLTLLGSATLTFNSNVDIDVTNVLQLDGTSQIIGTGTSRTLDAATLSIPATATNARISTILLTISGSAVIQGTASFAGPTMTVTNNLTVSGAFDVANVTMTINGSTSVTGTLTLSSNTGTKSFKGTVSIASGATWTSTAITSSGRLVFGSEVLSSGTFNPGCGY